MVNFALYNSGVKVKPGRGLPRGFWEPGAKDISYFCKICTKNKKMHCRAKASPKHLLLPKKQRSNYLSNVSNIQHMFYTYLNQNK